MQFDELDRLMREAVAREVQAGLPTLEGLEGRVVRRLARPPLRRPLWARIGEALSSVLVRPRWALAAGVALVAVGIVIGRWSLPPTRPLLASGGNLFTVAAPEAQEVAIVGDFSAWQPISLVDHEGDGVWTVTLALPPGRYTYAFIVDGRWVGQDPAAADHVRTFGEYVSVRYIGGDGL